MASTTPHRLVLPLRWRRVLHALLLCVPVAFVVSTVPGVRSGSGYSFVLDGLLNNLAYEAAAGLCLVRTLGLTGSRRGGYLLSIALAVYGSGNVFWTFFVRPLPDQPYPSGADAGFLLFYPLVFVALILLAKHRDARHARSLWLDGVVGALAVGAVAAAAVIGPIVSARGSWAAVATTSAYPALDLVLLMVLAAVLALYGWQPPKGLWLLAAGLVVFVVADMAYLFATAKGTYVSGGLTDGVWVSGVVLMGFTPGWTSAPTGPKLPTWALLSIPVLSTAVALGVLVTDHRYALHPVAVAVAAATILSALARLLFTLREVTKLAEQRELAQTDELTGLGNRRALYRRTPLLLAEATAGAPEATVALLLLDLDGFKEVNDSLGHQAGDALLRDIGRRLRQVTDTSLPGSAQTIVVRLGGDEFALVQAAGPSGALGLAEAVHAALDEPYDLQGVHVRARASVGVSVLPAATAELATLLRQADVAMYHAKSRRLGTFSYSVDVDEFASGERLETAELLRSDITARRMLLHYQPKVDVATGVVRSVEALVRWQHPRRGLLFPDAFLPVVETAGLMEELTRAVLEQALDQAARWWRAGAPLAVAVNLSASSLGDADLPGRVADLLAERGLPAHLLEIEITEDFLMADRVRAQGILDSLRRRGIRVAVDDYGTGYSSLAYLRQLPIDDLKLDKSFLDDLVGDPRALAIVRSTIMLAHSLGLRLVAEGVEDEATSRELAAAGCDVMQGWLYAKALPADELDHWLLEHDPRSVVRGTAATPDTTPGTAPDTVLTTVPAPALPGKFS
ncbi:putative bifunctional diguanylate cyclase/phosphodiesterase [Kineococcus rhizosphaerae]|uniref:Diguanylate cyclase/phosphodiesterase n=1 Tax=Kineococcus rhizosphaerae TaxID=559628 RepID=A0A2T0RAN2_9ACTN|nr:EAL domain-containing protein [Kineococcus rhizosphaerae]PRY18228.1 diguanylate cyclase/phosphodiesterase [Kineococcus rhizosphaerae]